MFESTGTYYSEWQQNVLAVENYMYHKYINFDLAFSHFCNTVIVLYFLCSPREKKWMDTLRSVKYFMLNYR